MGRGDQYSDIDILWDLPDLQFLLCLDRLQTILAGIRPVESLRSDPLFQHSEKHRLIFVRFAGVPLFWRLDVEVFAHSIGRDAQFDLDNPYAHGTDWSLTESALVSVIGAIKAHLRHQEKDARALLVRAYDRIGQSASATELRELLLNLVSQVARIDPAQGELAARVEDLAHHTFGTDSS
ncbi:MAG: hypothetical protein M1118_04740 [Chloroflexi bacterium]|nr:hypothetical protein [Chloroflexota bacterium]